MVLLLLSYLVFFVLFLSLSFAIICLFICDWFLVRIFYIFPISQYYQFFCSLFKVHWHCLQRQQMSPQLPVSQSVSLSVSVSCECLSVSVSVAVAVCVSNVVLAKESLETLCFAVSQWQNLHRSLFMFYFFAYISWPCESSFGCVGQRRRFRLIATH